MRWITVVSAFSCALLPMVAPTAAQSANLVTVEQAIADDPGHPPIPVVIWVPTAGEGLSLVVMSHGTGGGMTSHVDTAQALAEAGFVVVAPMHPGDNVEDDSIVGRADWFVDRSRHISKVIDYMIDQWPGHARLGTASVGVFGFSAGGTTALISAGGAPDRIVRSDRTLHATYWGHQPWTPASNCHSGPAIHVSPPLLLLRPA